MWDSINRWETSDWIKNQLRISFVGVDGDLCWYDNLDNCTDGQRKWHEYGEIKALRWVDFSSHGSYGNTWGGDDDSGGGLVADTRSLAVNFASILAMGTCSVSIDCFRGRRIPETVAFSLDCERRSSCNVCTQSCNHELIASWADFFHGGHCRNFEDAFNIVVVHTSGVFCLAICDEALVVRVEQRRIEGHLGFFEAKRLRTRVPFSHGEDEMAALGDRISNGEWNRNVCLFTDYVGTQTTDASTQNPRFSLDFECWNTTGFQPSIRSGARLCLVGEDL